MFNAIRSEWIKARSIKSTYIIIIISFGLFVISAAAYGYYKNNDFVLASDAKNRPMLDQITAGNTDSIWSISTEVGSLFALIALLVFAVLSVTSEYTYNTISTTLLATPKRLQAFLAKNIFVCLFVAISLAIAEIAAFFTTYLFTPTMRDNLGWSFEHCFTDEIDKKFGLQILAFVLLALISTSVGYILKNSAASVVIILLLVTNFISGILSLINIFVKQDIIATISLLMPDYLLREMTVSDSSRLGIVVQDGSETGSHVVAALSAFDASITLGVIALVLCVIAALLFKKRDV